MGIASLIISIVSAIIAVLSIIISAKQNHKLHNENKELSAKVSLSIDLLFNDKITGRVVEKKNALDSFNVWESKYTKYYVDNEISYDGFPKAAFTVVVKNNGKANATDIAITELKIISKADTKCLTERKLLFESCATDEIKANKIYFNCRSSDIDAVELSIEYCNVLNRREEIKYYFEKDNSKAMLRYVKAEQLKDGK